MQPGMPTRFSLSNVLSNTYNVPIWARVTMDVYFKTPMPLAASPQHAGPGASQPKHQHVVKRALQGSVGPEDALAQHPLSTSNAPSVPNELIPLMPSGVSGMEALSVVGGIGDRCGR
jgi:hypothetical protein